jgi:hypothetical protein
LLLRSPEFVLVSANNSRCLLCFHGHTFIMRANRAGRPIVEVIGDCGFNLVSFNTQAETLNSTIEALPLRGPPYLPGS